MYFVLSYKPTIKHVEVSNTVLLLLCIPVLENFKNGIAEVLTNKAPQILTELYIRINKTFDPANISTVTCFTSKNRKICLLHS